MAPEAGMECGRAAIPWTLALLRVESVSPACRLDFVACAAALCAPVLTLTLTCRIARLLGAAHYAPGYVSSRSQCCMCAAGCTNEKGTDCDNTFRKTATINASPYMPVGALVGIIVGAVVGVALIAFLVYKFILKKKAIATSKGAPDDGVTTTA